MKLLRVTVVSIVIAIHGIFASGQLSCTMEPQCLGETYCASDGICRDWGDCYSLDDCENPFNDVVLADCVGVEYCGSNGCGIDCDRACFSSESTCTEQTRGETLIQDLNVGDKVLTKSGQFKTVYTIDHHDVTKRADFIQIYYSVENKNPLFDNLEENHSVLEVTPSHMVFLHGVADPVAAHQLDVGDAIETKRISQNYESAVSSVGWITKILHISRVGVWNPITTDGTIVVDGVATSTYSVPFGDYPSSNEKKESVVSIGGVKLCSHQYFLHLAMAPYRVLCMGFSFFGNEKRSEYYYSNGYNAYSIIGKNLLEIVLAQNVVLQGLIILVFFVFFHLLAFLVSPPGVVAIAAMLYFLSVYKRKRTKKSFFRD